MEPDWWARGIALGAAGAATGNVIFTGLTYRRVHPKVRVLLYKTGVQTGTERNPEASNYQFILRFSNKGTTPVSVERIELVHYSKWYRTKEFRLVSGERFEAPIRPKLVIPGLDGITFRFNVATANFSDKSLREHFRFRVLLSNGETTVSSKLKPDEWLLPDD